MNHRIFFASTEKIDWWSLRNDHPVKSIEHITEVSVTKDLIIITRDQYFTKSHIADNIDAYDWNGNHLWNIKDIIGEICNLYCYGSVVGNYELIQFLKGMDKENLYIAGHDYYECVTDAHYLIIDLNEKKVVHTRKNK